MNPFRLLDFTATKNGDIIKHSVPTGKRWRILYGTGSLTTGVTAGNRVFILSFETQGGRTLYAPLYMVCPTNDNTGWQLGGQAATTPHAGVTAMGSEANVMLSDIVLEEDDVVKGQWDGFLLAEDSGLGVLRVEELTK